MDLVELQNLGQVFTKSGFFADTRDAAQAVVKVMAGMELGFPPIASMTGVYIVKGKVSLSANLMAAAIKKSKKYNYRVRQLDEKGCKIEFFEDGESVGVSSFTMSEAQAAKLHQDWDKEKREWKDKPTWKSFPRNMLFARAMSNGAKWFTPDIFGGPVYTPDELGAEVDGETGEVVGPVVEVEPADIELREEVQEVIQDALTVAAVRQVKLEGAQSTRKVGPKTQEILNWMGDMGWGAADLANYIYMQFKLSVNDADAVSAIDALDAGQKKALHQMVGAEANKGRG